MTAAYLLSLTVLSILLLLLLIIYYRMQAFIGLLVVSLLVAVAGGIPVGEIIDTIQEGTGSILGYIAAVVGIGTMVGEILLVSVGAKQIAGTLLSRSGEKRASQALALIGFIAAISIFVDVSLIPFIPFVYYFSRRFSKSLLYYGILLAVGIAVAHVVIAPAPGPVAVASLLGSGLGWVIFVGIIAGVPSALAGGVIWGRYIRGKLQLSVPPTVENKTIDYPSVLLRIT